ncbi:hypothetical protein NE865_14104 [Phthorimaea operculella]|nr:hypothetical protein NE865_14104 [Phthorimaea operculella]
MDLNSTVNKYGADNDDTKNQDDMSICLSASGEHEASLSPVYVTERQPRTNAPENENNECKNGFDDFKQEMRKLVSYYAKSQKDELSQVVTTLRQIKLSNDSIQSSVELLTAQNEEFKKRITQLENKLSEDRDYIIMLENRIEDLQTGSRKSNMEIKNVPKLDKETKQDLVEMVTCLAENIGSSFSKSDIRDIYRIRGKNEKKDTPIIVETNSVLLKTEFISKARSFNKKTKSKLCAKHLGLKTREDTPVFLSEHLTAKGTRLHFLARDLAKSREYKFVWTAYGKVYIRKNEQSPVIMITNENQIHQLLHEE